MVSIYSFSNGDMFDLIAEMTIIKPFLFWVVVAERDLIGGIIFAWFWLSLGFWKFNQRGFLAHHGELGKRHSHIGNIWDGGNVCNIWDLAHIGKHLSQVGDDLTEGMRWYNRCPFGLDHGPFGLISGRGLRGRFSLKRGRKIRFRIRIGRRGRQ